MSNPCTIHIDSSITLPKGRQTITRYFSETYSTPSELLGKHCLSIRSTRSCEVKITYWVSRETLGCDEARVSLKGPVERLRGRKIYVPVCIYLSYITKNIIVKLILVELNNQNVWQRWWHSDIWPATMERPNKLPCYIVWSQCCKTTVEMVNPD
jgi:hypothetical protein